ncbi:1-acyl-sn-glycerol-3-phosphate acyltransferase [Microlunatus elymi]|uniref:1-acyl-sn-glycerol-3-phosphate acyltransferase n=1 Tax=Microlunatus elymi TaxID=2596828 RepID=A0A516Q5W7_9ACTN|nr:1-acyl-sn-glycerol-3-phosphate acyltransferase [Microlunatus elymi]
MPTTPARSLRGLVRVVVGVTTALTRSDWRAADRLRTFAGEDGRGVILAVNHISNVDPLLVGSFLVRNGIWPRFLAKASLFGVPVLGPLLRAAGQIPVLRTSATAGDALEHAMTVLERGDSVVIYPEGTITDDPELWPMKGKTGAARLALRSGATVIPIGQWGAQQILYGKRSGCPRILPPKRISMLVGDPVRLDDLRSTPVTTENARIATRRIMSAITELVEELRPEQR